MLKKLILATVAGTALVSSAAFADGRWEHDRGWHHGWRHHHRYYAPAVVVRPAPVVVAPYYAPAPVYVAPPAPVYSMPAPAVVYPAPVYAEPSISVRLRFPL